MINVVLFEPEIPQNAGNIARLCACTGAKLYLVGKLGFSMTDKYMKRSGLDYWDKVDVVKLVNFSELLEIAKDNEVYYFTTKGLKAHTEVYFKDGDFLVFGAESRGLPKEIMELNPNNHLRLPMRDDTRSLNLSNTVAVGVYEAIRQIGGIDV